MKGPSTALLPFLCMKCNGRAQEHLVEHHTGDVIEICRCGRLVNRSKGEPAQRVIFQRGDGVLYQFNAGDEQPKKLSEPHLTNYLKSLVS